MEYLCNRYTTKRVASSQNQNNRLDLNHLAIATVGTSIALYYRVGQTGSTTRVRIERKHSVDHRQ
jgi:hypothetical protein